MSRKNEDNSDEKRDDKNPCHQNAESNGKSGNSSWSSKQVRTDFCLDEKGPNAAKKFNDLIAKTLKLQE